MPLLLVQSISTLPQFQHEAVDPSLRACADSKYERQTMLVHLKQIIFMRTHALIVYDQRFLQRKWFPNSD